MNVLYFFLDQILKLLTYHMPFSIHHRRIINSQIQFSFWPTLYI